MEVLQAIYDVYTQNGARMGQMDEHGVVRNRGNILLRVERGSIYSMHGQYIGKCKNGVGRSDHGQVIFTLKPV